MKIKTYLMRQNKNKLIEEPTYNRRMCIKLIISIPIFFLCLISFLFFKEYNLLRTNYILELAFFLTSLILCLRIDKTSFKIQICIVTYILISLLMTFFYTPAGIYDFLLIFKSFIYVVCLSTFISKRIFEYEYINKLYIYLICIFSAKYLISHIFGIVRPGVFTENNFELLFLMLMFVTISNIKGKVKFVDLVFIVPIILLSGSKSGIATFMIVLVLLLIKNNRTSILLGVIYLLMFIPFLFLVFLNRMPSDISAVDRYQYFILFFYEISNWTWQNYLFGTQPITPLTTESSIALSHFEGLFSSYDPSICYSVGLHTFIIRTIFDHGLLGLFFLLSFVNFGLKRAGFRNRDRLSVISILLLNGLSVSSMNSVYAIIPLAIMFSIDRRNDSLAVEKNKLSYQI